MILTGHPIAQVASELGIGESMLGRWVSQERDGQTGEPTRALSTEERAELRALRRQVEELRKDNKFLGKAAAFFASKHPLVNGTN